MISHYLWQTTIGKVSLRDKNSAGLGYISPAQMQILILQLAEPEFKEWAWLKPDELITRAVVFKRPVYQTVITHFSDLLKV